MPVLPSASAHEADVAVVGAGAAGLYAALCAARQGADVVLISATPLAQTASYWAQGGLAAALAADDSFELHLKDTEVAGRDLVRHSAAEILVREAPDCVRDLQALGVRFDADRFRQLALGLEGGHSVRRVVHAGGSATGRRVVRQLSALAAEEPRIDVFEGARAQALWRSGEICRGLICDDGRVIAARAVVIATGGAASLWARTTNPPGSQGIGMLLAHAAGAALADLELLQFHPTAVIGVRGREGGLDPARELIPVAPAAHYTMGGIVADLHARSTLPGLYAVGEASCTGLHGANRLASNSLSECFVFARRAVAHALSGPATRLAAPGAAEMEALRALQAPPAADRAIREALWQEAGIVRSEEGLSRLLEAPHPLARLIARCALARTESRGAHVRTEYPKRDPSLDHRHAVVGEAEAISWQSWT